jgi:hypothetical protein
MTLLKKFGICAKHIPVAKIEKILKTAPKMRFLRYITTYESDFVLPWEALVEIQGPHRFMGISLIPIP